MAWSLHDQSPLYQQLMEVLQHRILTGHYRAGQRLPSVRDLAQEAAVNPNTMQRALTELENSGLVITHRTTGRYITEDQRRIDDLRRRKAQEYTHEYLLRLTALGYRAKDAQDFLQNHIEEATS